jgi:hypothetical protein
MSITIGIYDLFAYTLPGFLYLYVIYEFLDITRIVNINIIKLIVKANLLEVLLIAVAAFLVGQIFDGAAHWFVFDVVQKYKTSQALLDRIKQRDSRVDIEFEAKDWHLLLILLRQRNLDVAQTFDKHEADSIMFRNISFMALLNSLVMAAGAVMEHSGYWIGVIISLFICVVSARRSRTLHGWFFEGIFLASLEYGRNIEQVLSWDGTKHVLSKKRKVERNVAKK